MRKLYTICSNQGTATTEATLCEDCFTGEDAIRNQEIIRTDLWAKFIDTLRFRTVVGTIKDEDFINPSGTFVDSSENEAIACHVCGYAITDDMEGTNETSS